MGMGGVDPGMGGVDPGMSVGMSGPPYGCGYG
jgi:hypothetical protein